MKRRILSILMLAVMSLAFFAPEIPFVPSISVTAEAAETVSAPKADVASGSYALDKSSMTVKLTCSTKGSTIYYSLNGAAYKKYSSSVSVTKNSTLKAYAKTSGGKSKTVTYSYKLKPKLYLEQFKVDGGIKVKYTSKPANTTIYYTTDGTKPTTSSAVFPRNNYITLNNSCKIRLLVTKPNWTSVYFSRDFEVEAASYGQKGEANFAVPSAGKANVVFNGKSMTVDASYSSTSNSKGKYDSIEVSLGDEKTVRFNININKALKEGTTLTESSFTSTSGSNVGLYKWGLHTPSTFCSTSSDDSPVKVVKFKPISLDFTGKKPSSFYFYVEAQDMNDASKKQSAEGIAKVYIKNSKRTTGASGNSSLNGNIYTSAKTESKFEVPELGYANVIVDGTSSTVPVAFETSNATEYNPNDRYLGINLDGKGKNPNSYVAFDMLSTSAKWKTGSEYSLSDLKSKENYIYLKGYYQYYMQYLGKYSDSVISYLNSDYFDDAVFNVIDLDSAGKKIKFYFYVKSHSGTLSHEMEGVGYAELDGTVPDGNGSGSTGGNTGGSTIVNPGTTTTPKVCAVCQGTTKCSPCGGTGKVWGWKKKITCSTCHGTGVCPYCVAGWVY